MQRSSRQVQFIAHNIRSAENIGSLLRTCDSLGVSKLWITGYSPQPSHPKVKKTALGAEHAVAWESVLDVMDTILRLKQLGFRIVGLEITSAAINLVDYQSHLKTVLLLGNEVEGLTPSLLAVCDDVIAISQRGSKESLNVAVAAGIAGFWMMNAQARVDSK